MAEYLVETHLKTGEFVARLPYRNLQFEVGFNRPYGMRCNVPLYHPLVTSDTIKPGLHELWVRRNGTVVAAGPLWDIVTSSNDMSISLEAMGLEDYFDVRLIGGSAYSTLDQTAWAWNLINTSQLQTNGNYGIIQGTLGTGVTRTLEFREYDQKYVLEAIQDMANAEDGFDFWIQPSNRAFNAMYPRPQTDRNLVLKYPEHISSYSIQYFGKFLRNYVSVQGPDPWQATAQDPASQTTYGRRDFAESYHDAKHINELTALASRLRDIRSKPRAYPTLVLRKDLINIFDTSILQYGDKVKIYIKDGFTDIDTQYRYGGAQVTVSKTGHETVVLYMQDLSELS